MLPIPCAAHQRCTDHGDEDDTSCVISPSTGAGITLRRCLSSTICWRVSDAADTTAMPVPAPLALDV